MGNAGIIQGVLVTVIDRGTPTLGEFSIMSSLKKLISASAIAVALTCGWSQQSQAALMLDVQGGRLFGATGVNVNGTLFDVMFMDGICADLFSGCNSDDDFAFDSESGAAAAGQALLAQVFIDGALGDFDSDADLTNGCGVINPQTLCSIIIPFDAPVSGDGYLFKTTRNSDVEAFDEVPAGFGQFDSLSTNVTENTSETFGIFKNPRPAGIPEPATLTLFGMGLAAFAIARRRAKGKRAVIQA